MKVSSSPSRFLVPAAGLTVTVACATAGSSGALEPRYVAVHNALAAMGLAQVGPIHEGSLLQGHEAKVALDLPAGCTTVVALGGEGLSDIDATLFDSQARPIAHDTTTEAQAVLRACLDAPDTYALVVRAAAGAGSWVAATWAGGVGGPAPAVLAAVPTGSGAPLGTCASPIPLAAGTVTGTTSHGEASTNGSCATQKTDAPEAVYELDVSQRERVVIDLQARFDAVLYVRKGDCTDENAEVDCNDDVPGEENHSHLEDVLDPGKYFVFVDGYNREAGGFKITVTVSDAVALGDACRRAGVLTSGAIVSATSASSTDTTGASCGGGAEGADAAWRMALPSSARVRLVERSDDFAPVVHVRHACAFEESELACAEASTAAADAAITGVFPAGAYTVFADAREPGAKGAYTLSLDTGSVEGDGTAGDTCEDAIPIPLRNAAGAPHVVASASGDTFPARDDVAGSCGGQDAPDVVYRVDLSRRSRLTAQLSAEDAPHLLVARSGCAANSGEVGCGRSLDQILDPGSYFIAVDGLRPDAFGRFELEVAADDVSGQPAACASAPTLTIGRNAGALSGAGHHFATSCAAAASAAGNADRVYKLVLPSRAAVNLSLTARGFEGAIALRRTCADGPGGAAAAEIACESGRPINEVLEAGTYWVLVDDVSPGRGGSYVVKYDFPSDAAPVLRNVMPVVP